MSDTETFAAYINARVRGMKSALFSSSDLTGLVDAADIKALENALLSSPYENEMAESMTRYEGADAVEDAVSKNLVTTFAKLQRLCSGELGELAGIFLARFDLISVKSLLRNQHAGLDSETGEQSLFPGPSLTPALMRELASLDAMDALVRGLSAWNVRLCRGLVEKLPEYQESRNLRVLEDALDRGYFVNTIRRLENNELEDAVFLRNLLRTEIDRINLRRLLAPRAPGEEAEDVVRELLPKGTLPTELLREIASATTPERAVETLTKTAYSEMEDALLIYGQTGKFARLDRAFEQAFMARLKRASQQHALSVSILMLFAWLKYNEVINVRMIARGMAIQLPKSRIEEEMVHV
jgi:ATP synthase A1 C subunit